MTSAYSRARASPPSGCEPDEIEHPVDVSDEVRNGEREAADEDLARGSRSVEPHDERREPDERQDRYRERWIGEDQKDAGDERQEVHRLTV